MTVESIEALATALGRGEFTSETLVQRLLDRTAVADPVLHAFTSVFAEHALHQARALDGERARGTVRSPLHGIPLVLKDVVNVARQRTTGGSRLYEDNFARADAEIVRRLIGAGAVVLGKTHLVELAFGGWGTNAVMGTPRNPWDLATHRAPGGSSSGAAVAVAAGLAPAAIGTDTGGSVRIPAALCGVVGLKTTAGQMPRDGVMLLSESLDTIGLITRSVRDAALVYTALASAGPALAATRPAALPANPRIGMLASRDIADVEADVMAGYDSAAGHLSDLGALLAGFSFGQPLDSTVERMGIIIAHEGWQAHGLRILQDPAIMDPHVRARFLQGQRIPIAQYRAARRDQAASQQAIHKALERFDAVLTPTTPIPAPPLADIDENALPLSRYTRVVNYLGLCALAVPAGLGASNLPVSIQLIGRPGSEPMLLALGEALEERRGPFPSPDLAALGLP
jgi:aspartyl-tRNA(Asn)/glutamyl-tRNA(Gln) amidotransferase subunit A